MVCVKSHSQSSPLSDIQVLKVEKSGENVPATSAGRIVNIPHLLSKLFLLSYVAHTISFHVFNSLCYSPFFFIPTSSSSLPPCLFPSLHSLPPSSPLSLPSPLPFFPLSLPSPLPPSSPLSLPSPLPSFPISPSSLQLVSEWHELSTKWQDLSVVLADGPLEFTMLQSNDHPERSPDAHEPY